MLVPNPELEQTIKGYLAIKEGGSQAVDRLLADARRSPVPQFSSPQAAADYYFHGRGNPYTGDPAGGVLDYYLHPERLQAALEGGPDALRGMHIDCDDVALFYKASLRQLAGCDARIFTLIDLRIAVPNMSHVICAGAFNGQPFGLDTNGYRPLPDLSEQTLCDVWGTIYVQSGASYAAAIETRDPFH